MGLYPKKARKYCILELTATQIRVQQTFVMMFLIIPIAAFFQHIVGIRFLGKYIEVNISGDQLHWPVLLMVISFIVLVIMCNEKK